MTNFNVLVDTQEKIPWELNSSRVIGKEFISLKTGDYTVQGLEDKLCIERKMSVNELSSNIHQDRFKRELERMRFINHSYIILEANAEDVFEYPRTANLPPKIKAKVRTNGNYLMRCFSRMQIKYGIKIIFAGNRNYAQRIAVNLMEDVAELYE